VAMLPIAVAQADFLKKAGEPKDDDLKSLYEKAKDRLYDPSSPEAAFKQPARIQVEWISAKADSPRFQKAADIANAAIQLTVPLAYRMAVLSEYQTLRWRHAMPSWTKDEFLLHDSSLNRSSNVAAAVGRALAGSGIQGPAVLSALGGYYASAAAHEVRDRLHAGAGLLLTGAAGSPLAVAAALAGGTPKTEYQPVEKLMPFLVDRLRENTAQKLVSATLETLEKDLQDRSRNKPDFSTAQVDIQPREVCGMVFGTFSSGVPWITAGLVHQEEKKTALANARAVCGTMLANMSAAAPVTAAGLIYRDQNLTAWASKKQVAESIAKYDLLHGSSSQPRDKYDVGSDPGLAPLQKAFNRPWSEIDQPESTARQFASELFQRLESGGLYDPQRASVSFGGEEFLYWKTGHKGDYVPSFDEIKDRVKARWQFEKARPSAREEAERVAAALPKNTSGEDAKRSLTDGSKLAGKLFELDHVARLVLPRSAVSSRTGSGSFERYKPPDSKIEYSTPGLVNQLLDLKEEGKVVVVHDKPEGTYYVALLVHRSQAYELSFYHDAAKPDSLLDWFERENKFREQNRQACLDELRREAKLMVDEEALKNQPQPAQAGDE
jgi:hypothetical protein